MSLLHGISLSSTLYLNKEFNVYWDEFISFYVKYEDVHGLELFYEIGRPVFFKTADQMILIMTMQ